MGWFQVPAGGRHSDHKCGLHHCNEESTHVNITVNTTQVYVPCKILLPLEHVQVFNSDELLNV